MKQERTYRMYGLTPYNLSPIQQGIQFGHAVVEYARFFSDNNDYKKWSAEDKTFIILNGGTTNTNMFRPGTLNKHADILLARNISFADFYEPDLGDQLTAIVFLVDDRVWDKEAWPDLELPYEKLSLYKQSGYAESMLESFEEFRVWKYGFSHNEDEANNIVFMRTFLKNFRLA